MSSTGNSSRGRRHGHMRLAILSLAALLLGPALVAVPAVASVEDDGSPSVERSTSAVQGAPASGALFGVFPGRNPGHVINAFSGPDLVTYLPAMNRWQGRRNGVINAFGPLADTNNTFLNYFPTIWNTHRAVPMYSAVNNQDTHDEILAGAADSDLIRFRTELAKWIHGTDAHGVPAPSGGRRLYIRLHFEPNTSVLYTTYSPAAIAANCDELLVEEQKYVASWRYIHDMIMQPGLFSPGQVQWVFSVLHVDAIFDHLKNCPNGASAIAENIYPGDDYVDWLGIDGFTIQEDGAPDDNTPAQVFDPMHDRLRAISTRPMSFNEVGTSTTARTNRVVQTTAWKDQWIADYFAYMQTNDIKMSVWNNIVHTPVDWAVFTPDDGEALTGLTPVGGIDYLQSRGSAQYTDTAPPVTYNVYSAYKAGVNLPYFTEPDLSDPRLISDEVFRGTW